jgi:hypothetical protein
MRTQMMTWMCRVLWVGMVVFEMWVVGGLLQLQCAFV